MPPVNNNPSPAVPDQSWKDRGSGGCLCCGSTTLENEPTLTSLFLSRKAWHGPPELTRIHRCRDCDFRFYERALSDREARNLYEGYRSDDYQQDRSRDEPFYTKRVHAEIMRSEGSEERRAFFRSMLNRAGIGGKFGAVLDYGGADGRLIIDLDADRKAVYDLAGTAALDGIERVASAEPSGEWDLVVCAQTLEHVSEPISVVRQLLQLARPGGHVFLEVPLELWRRIAGPRSGREMLLRQALRRRWLHVVMDIYSTAFRLTVGVVPPFGWIPMREHVNFFSVASIEALARRSGGELVYCSEPGANPIVAVLRRRPS